MSGRRKCHHRTNRQIGPLAGDVMLMGLIRDLLRQRTSIQAYFHLAALCRSDEQLTLMLPDRARPKLNWKPHIAQRSEQDVGVANKEGGP